MKKNIHRIQVLEPINHDEQQTFVAEVLTSLLNKYILIFSDRWFFKVVIMIFWYLSIWSLTTSNHQLTFFFYMINYTFL